jgi:transcription elongation factor Elf1
MTDFEHKLTCTECQSESSFTVEFSVVCVHVTCAECDSLYSFGLMNLASDPIKEISDQLGLSTESGDNLQ